MFGIISIIIIIKREGRQKMNKAEQTKNKYLKSIYSVIQAELKQMVKQAESKPYTTQNNYGEYMKLLTTLTGQLGLDNSSQLLVMAGGNKQGILDAKKILKA